MTCVGDSSLLQQRTSTTSTSINQSIDERNQKLKTRLLTVQLHNLKTLETPKNQKSNERGGGTRRVKSKVFVSCHAITAATHRQESAHSAHSQLTAHSQRPQPQQQRTHSLTHRHSLSVTQSLSLTHCQLTHCHSLSAHSLTVSHCQLSSLASSVHSLTHCHSLTHSLTVIQLVVYVITFIQFTRSL